MRGVAKRFGDVAACVDVDFEVRPGEIVGLLGENGAGKTTLMNIAFGAYAPDAGSVTIGGRAQHLASPADALAAGIGMVHQHFRLVPSHTVLENLLAGAPARGARLDFKAARAKLAAIGERHGLLLAPDARVAELSAGEQQRLEIVKALFRGAHLLILDEPTSVLTPQQAQALFAALRKLSANGVGIVFISHKLRDVLALVQRMVIMRRGHVVDARDNDGQLDARALATMMCGENIAEVRRAPSEAPGETLLELRGITSSASRRVAGGAPALRDINLDVRAGEIVGIAGVSGSGQGALAEIAAGSLRARAGEVRVAGHSVPRATRAGMQARGVAFVPEDRAAAGLIGALSLRDNLLLSHYRRAPFSRLGWLRPGSARRFARELMKRHDIRASDERVRTATLSGGNQQKALLARELANDPRLLVVAQPTQGLDAGAVAFVHRTLLDIRQRGRAVLLISEDLDELLALSDRIVVMFDGRIAGELPGASATPAEVGLLMTGAGA